MAFLTGRDFFPKQQMIARNLSLKKMEELKKNETPCRVALYENDSCNAQYAIIELKIVKKEHYTHLKKKAFV